MNVRFDPKGVTTSFEDLFWAFFDQAVTGADPDGVDPSEDLRREPPQLVFQGLSFVPGQIVPVSRPQHLAQRLGLIGQFLSPVVVRIKPETHDAQHPDRPRLHAGSPQGIAGQLAISMAGKPFLEDRKDCVSQFARRRDGRPPDEQFRAVVPRFGIEHEGFDRKLAQTRLPRHDFPHRLIPEFLYTPRGKMVLEAGQVSGIMSAGQGHEGVQWISIYWAVWVGAKA